MIWVLRKVQKWKQILIFEQEEFCYLKFHKILLKKLFKVKLLTNP